jgi:tetratricopeptide (TPR) repeat protein
MTSETPPSSAQLRQEGNALYKDGKFTAAIQKYEEAAKASDGKDALPYSNLSAVLFESGKYNKCTKACQTALELIEPTNEDLKRKLESRITQASREAAVAGKKLSAPVIANWKAVTRDLSLCKPILYQQPLYSRVGNDGFQSLVDDKLAIAHGFALRWEEGMPESLVLWDSSKYAIDLLFAGCGDARHFFATLIQLAPVARGGDLKLPLSRFTLNDFKPSVLARDLIVFNLLEKLGRQPEADERAMLLTILFFTYTCSVMPSIIFERLQSVITECIQWLRKDNNAPVMLEWLSIEDRYSSDTIEALTIWQQEIPERYTTEDMLRAASSSTLKGHVTAEWRLRREQVCHDKTMFMQPMHDVSSLDPELYRLRTAYLKNKKKTKELRQYILRSWKVNPTLFEAENDNTLDTLNHCAVYPWDSWLALSCNNSLPLKDDAGSLCEYFAPVFECTALVLQQLSAISKLKVYFILGDVAQYLEDLRYTGMPGTWSC